MVKNTVFETIRKHNMISENMHIVLGLSGGPDSVCLFYVLLELKNQLGIIIHPVHVNHKFRPGAAEEDQEYVEEICRREGLECRSFVYDCNRLAKEMGVGSEEAGRFARYEAFSIVADEIEKTGVSSDRIAIAVAQNGDDRAETVLFRILRGTGTDGISSISYVRSDGSGRKIIRPLLDVSRKDIESYCFEKNLEPRIDRTNLEPLYTRNRIRLQLLPYLEENYNPNVKEALNRLAEIALEDKEYFDRTADKRIDEIMISSKSDGTEVDGPGLAATERAVRKRIIARLFFRLGLSEDLTFAHYEACDNIIFSDRSSARTDLPRGYYLAKDYDRIRFGNDFSDAERERLIEDIKIRVLPINEFNESRPENGSFCAFDFDAMEEKFGQGFEELIVMRHRKPGDYMKLKGSGTKKIQNLLVDMKIPKWQRDRIFMVALGSEILWLKLEDRPGRYSGICSLNRDTKTVISIEIVRLS